jgi:hypothetical protein
MLRSFLIAEEDGIMSKNVVMLTMPRFSARRITVNPNGGILMRYILEKNTDLRPLLSQEVLLNGKRYLVSGLEYPNHPPPWRKGEKAILHLRSRPARASG